MPEFRLTRTREAYPDPVGVTEKQAQLRSLIERGLVHLHDWEAFDLASGRYGCRCGKWLTMTERANMKT